MATGIIITGSSGAGKTTLGELVAKKLGYTFVDIDEYIWRKDTQIPFSAMYSKTEKISRLQVAISNCEHFVMAGSMDSFHEYFDPYFELVVHLHTDAKTRVKRVHERELGSFGERVLEGGDMYEEHEKMLTGIAGYDHGFGGCTLQQHEKWLKSLDCRVIHLDGADTLEKNLNIIIETYKSELRENMQMLNYDFYDLYALLIFLRADTDKVSEYAGAIEQIVHCLEEPVSQSELEGNAVRKILQTYVSETEQGLSWVWTENKYTSNVVIMKNVGHYRILSEVFREMLRSIGDGRRLWHLCDATHNIPTLLVECKEPKQIIKSMIKIYQKEYNKNFLVEELKQLDK